MPLIYATVPGYIQPSSVSVRRHLKIMGHIQRRREGAYDLAAVGDIPGLFDEPIFGVEDVLDYRLFVQGEQLYVDVGDAGRQGYL
jgi:hypothetical protein